MIKSDNKAHPRPEVIELHLDDLSGVRSAAEEFKARCGGQLSILINNAGKFFPRPALDEAESSMTGVMATPYGKTKDGFETQMGTNHFAHFLLFQLLKPLLLQTAKDTTTTSRVICVSSAAHRFGRVRFDE